MDFFYLSIAFTNHVYVTDDFIGCPSGKGILIHRSIFDNWALEVVCVNSALNGLLFSHRFSSRTPIWLVVIPN